MSALALAFRVLVHRPLPGAREAKGTLTINGRVLALPIDAA
jgi:hypothetical protein